MKADPQISIKEKLFHFRLHIYWKPGPGERNPPEG
jgi:hypothetical protein